MTGGPLQLFGTGLGLSAAAGLNSYAVLLVYGAMARFFPEDYPGTIARLLSSSPALIAAAILFFLEFFADKIPGLDHFWHLLHSFVRPLVGALVAIAAVQPEGSTVLDVVAGGSGGTVALVSHLVKSATRLTSTALTAGIANAGISLAEDILAFLQSLVSIFLPLVALLVVAAIGLLFVLTVPRMARSIDLFGRRRSGGPPASAAVLVLFFLAAPVARGARPDDALTDVGAVPREVAGAREIARLDGETRLDRVLLVLPRRDPEGLARLLANQQDPASPGFRSWLSPAEFERRFGASDEDVVALRDWLTSHGLEMENAPAGRAALVFSGRASDVELAFATELHEVFASNQVRIANTRPPRLPLGLARRVVGVLSLHNFRRRRPLVRPRPANTSGGSHFLAPADLTAIYGIDAFAASGINGGGRTIGLLARTNVNIGDTTFFRSYFGLPANDPVVVLNGPDPGIVHDSDPGDDDESDLDLQWAGAIAPAARTLLVASDSTATADGVDLSALYAVSNNLADVLSLSYGACELDFEAADTAFYTNVWAQAAAQGISVLVASGDSGAAGCDPTGPHALSASVNGLCSSPYATCVGGTQFLDLSSPSTFWNATNDPTTKKSVRGYIPETTWSGSGGGKSILFPRPPWQNVAGLPADNARYVPDVSLAASLHTPYMFVRGHTTGTTGLITNFGGTSFSSPALAGLAALLSQKAGIRLGNLNPLLYAAGRAQYGQANVSSAAPLAGAPAFHDITTGDNGGYAAGPGYDATTGLGSVDAAALASALPGPAPATTDFTLGATPAAPVLPPGGSTVVNLTLSQSGPADADAVASMTISGLPLGVAAEFRPANPANTTLGVVARTQPATLTLSSVAAPSGPGPTAGTYRLDLTATSGAIVRRIAVFLTVGGGAATPPAGVVVQAPVVLDVFGAASSHFTSDFVAVNRSASDATLVLAYVPAAFTPGAGGPAVARSLAAGQQLYIPDVIAFLAANGWSLPSDRSGKLGTFFATFVGVSDPAAVFAGSRASTPNLSASVGGAFGTFAPAVPSGVANGSGETWIYGLRQNASFRSNLAVVHAPGTPSGTTSGPVSLEIQLFDGDSGAPVGAPLTRTLQAGEFFQYNEVLKNAPAGVTNTNGYARLTRTSGSDRFIAYGVVNDGGSAGGGTSDGSFLGANPTEGLVPILLDLPGPPHFTSDLTLTNPASAPVTVSLTYTASTQFSGAGSGTRTTTLAAGQQLVKANALSFLRDLGLAIPTTGAQGGTLLVAGAVAQARTSNPNLDFAVGGSYGLSYPAVASSARAKGEAWVYGLRQDADVRSNLAIADARAGNAAGVEYVADVFDADVGSPTPVLTKRVTLEGGQWTQFTTILFEAGLTHGYVRVRLSTGTSDFAVYGVVNDGPGAGTRTSDGSYVPMVVTN